jgi:hypothetical protein
MHISISIYIGDNVENKADIFLDIILTWKANHDRGYYNFKSWMVCQRSSFQDASFTGMANCCWQIAGPLCPLATLTTSGSCCFSIFKLDNWNTQKSYSWILKISYANKHVMCEERYFLKNVSSISFS